MSLRIHDAGKHQQPDGEGSKQELHTFPRLAAEACRQLEECPEAWRGHPYRPHAREDPELQLSGQRVQDVGADDGHKGLFASEPGTDTLLHDDTVTEHSFSRGTYMLLITARTPRLVKGDVAQLLFQSLNRVEIVAKEFRGQLPHNEGNRH